MTWTRGATLVALILTSLVGVAAPQPVVAAGTYFTEDFSAGFGPNLTSLTGSPSVGGGVVTMPSSNNNVVRTNDSDYQTDSFCAEITVVNYVGGGDNRAYLGFGSGNIIGADGDFPREGPAVVIRSIGRFGGPTSIDNLSLLTAPDVGVAGSEIRNAGGQGLGSGGYTLQIGYDVFAQEVRASVDGLQFGPTVDVSGYDFTGNGRIFFAGQGVTFDDFSLQAGQCSTTPRTFTVNTAADILNLPTTIDGFCDDSFGVCRLREAMLEANAFGGVDTIAFDIDGTGPHTIAPLAALPVVTDSVIIDGYTQPGATPNTLVDGNDADIRIELAGQFINGVALDFTATDNSTVRGLAINQFFGGGATAIRAGTGTVIEGNFIGTDVTGTVALPNWDGIYLLDAPGVTIGGPDPAQRNVISGNDQSAVAIFGNSDEVTVQGNFIGTDAGGSVAIPNRSGLYVQGSDVFSIAEPAVINFLTVADNVISGNSSEGIALWGATIAPRIVGNNIGVGVDGVTPLGNNPAPGLDAGGFGGVVIRNYVRDAQIGGDGVGEGNLIGYNSNGVTAFSGINNRIVGNEFIGNTRLGVSLPLANTNDPGDADSPRAVSYFSHPSANFGQNSPELTSVGILPSGDLQADYSIDSLTTESAYPISIDFYAADTSSSGEGRIRLGTASAVVPGAGTWNLGDAAALGVAPGASIVAMATDFEGNSSPFSAVAFVDDIEKVTVGSDGDRVGQAVALDGNRMAVSAPNADVGAPDAGVVYVYDRDDADSPWQLTATIPAPSPEFGARFGNALDLRGDLLAVGESAREDEGRVWVFRLSGGVWSQLGGWIEAEGNGLGNEFGASIAWTGDTSLAIGAPGAVGGQGRVYTASLVSGEGGFWVVSPLFADFGGSPPPAGAQLGFAVAFDDSPAGDGRLVAGAPGASRRYEWNLGAIGNPGVAQFDVTWNMGSAVDISGDRVVTGGISDTDQLRVNVNESTPVQRSNTTALGPVVPATLLNGAVNDYLDIEGQNVAVSRGGGGGRVELYGINGLLTLDDLTTYEPPATPGDLVGWAIDLGGRTLIAGAPGTNADAGAVFSTDVGVTATWTGFSSAPFSDPANWDIGVVPGPNDTAHVPLDKIMEVDVDTVVGRLVVESSVVVGDGVSLESGSTVVRNNADIYIAPGGELVLRNDALVDGFVTVDEGGASGRGLLTLDGAVAMSGVGDLTVFGGLEKTGPGTATVDVDEVLTVGTTVVSVNEGTLELTGADLRDGRDEVSVAGFVGEASVAAGAELRVVGDLLLTDATSIGVDIDGDASPGSYGRITVTGTLTKDGALNAALGGYVPTAADSYDIITCADCTPGAFATTNVDPLAVTTTSTSVTLALPSDQPIVVDSLLDTVADDGLCTLREAITAANSDSAANGCIAGSGADTINFAVSGAIVLDTRLPIITSDIEIDGTDVDITLDGRGGSGTAILRINSGTVSLSNLLVFRGNEQSCPNLPTDPDNLTFCGAVLNYWTLNVSQVTFDRNQANNGAGAAIANRGATSVLTVDRSTFTNQSTPFTGGISNWGDAVVSNSTFVDNGRAAIENRTGATMDVVNSTFTGSGVGLNNSGTLTLRNSVVNGAVGLTCEGTIIADGFNLDTDGTCGGATTVTLAGLDLQPLADNGGPTQTVGLGASSVAIDAGDDTVCSAAPVNGIDQRGLGRPSGPSCDSGAFEAIRPTFINPTAGAAWGDPANWSTGAVPGPTDAAIIPDGTNVTVFGPGTTSVGSLTLAGSLYFDSGGTGLRFEILGDSVIEASGSLFVIGSFESGIPYTNTLALSGELQVDGSFAANDQLLVSGVEALLARSTPVVELNDGASFSGDGSVFLLAQFVKNGPGTVTFGPDLDVDLDVDPTFDIVSGTLEVNGGTLDIQSAAPNGSFVGDGTIAVGPGATVNLPSGTVLGASSVVDIGIAGSSSNANNYGRLLLPNGASAGTLSATFTSIPAYAPNIFDRYPVVDCGESTCAPFPTSLGSLDQIVVGGDIVLGIPSTNPTFIDASGDGLWRTAANWNTGVVPGTNDTAEIPAGVTAFVSVADVFDVGALDIAGEVQVDLNGTLTVTGGPDGALPTRIRSGGRLTVLSADTLNIAAESVVIEAGGALDVGSIARLVFTGTVAQTVTGEGQFFHGGIVRNENPQSVTIAGTLDYQRVGDSSFEAATGALRFGPTDLGLTTLDIESGATFGFTAASATAAGNFEVRGTLESRSLSVSGIVQVRAGGLFVPDGTLDISGGQVVTAELAPRGEIQLLDGASITGTGLVANSGDVVTTGAVTIGSGVTWNSGRNSVLDVQSGALDVQSLDFDAQGGLTVSPGGRIDFVGNTILRPSSNLVFGVADDGSAGIISTQQLGFEVFGVGDPDQTRARIELDLVDGSAPVGPITIFECTNCAADPPGIANGVEFDEFVTGAYDVIVGRNTVDVAILDNKNRSAAGGTGFGSSVSVDGDRAVVGSFDGITGPAVLERVGEAWQVVQELSNSSSVNVTLDGDQFIADGVLYEFDAEFDATNLIGGTSFDFDGDLALLGDDDSGFPATAQVFGRTDFATALAVLEPGTVPASYGSDVALLDLGGGSALAAVSAPDTGEVYIFEQVDGAWSTSEVRTLTSPDGDGNRFGDSISISGSALVVGEPLNDSPRGDGGTAWVYPLEGTGVADTPVKLTPSRIDGGDQFGSDVSIDGTVVVVGASVAQKFDFPIRDGAAFVFQFDGIDWVETDELRAPDAFSFELFGDAVAVSGTSVLVGARRDRNSNGFEAGAVYDFDVVPVAPAINTFTGVVDSSWADPANWSSGSVPVIGEPAIIPVDENVELPGGFYAVGALSLAGTLSTSADATDIVFLLGAGSVIESTGQLNFGGSFECVDPLDPGCVSANRLTIGGDLVIDGRLDTSARFLTGGPEVVRSTPQVVVGDDTAITGDGTFFIAVPLIKSGTGTSTFGPDLDVELFGEPPAPTAVRGVLQIDEGTLDVQSIAPNGSFAANGTIEVAPGATVSVAGDLSLSATSALSFRIDGPSAGTDNYGRIVLPTGTLVADGTLSVTADGYTPTFNDAYPLIACTAGSCTGGAFGVIEVDPLVVSTSTGVVSVRGPDVPIELDFDLRLAPGSPVSLPVAPTGIAVSQIDRQAIARNGGGSSNVAASSITSIGPEDTSLASIQLGATPLRAIVAESETLSAIPLVNIDIDGGWGPIIAGSELENEPLSSLTFGQVLELGDPTDSGYASTPAGRLSATPLRAIDVDGTPLRAIPLAAVALGATPLRAIPLRAIEAGAENPWCAIIGDLVDEYPSCDEALDDLNVTEITLRGVPLRAIPLRAIPLRAIDVTDSPLRAIALSDIDLSASPIGAIPLRAIPLRAIELAESPLRAIPLRAIPLRAIPVSALDLSASPLRAIELRDSPLRAIDTSITLEAAPLRAIEADGSAVSAIQVQGAPLRAIPLSAIMLADVPLRAIPLEDGGDSTGWCAVLAEADAGFDCTNGVDLDQTTLSELSIRGVPLRAIPLRAIPLRAILQDSSIGAIPLRAIPLRAIPLRAIPLGGIPLSTDLGSIDVNGTPLRAIPLRAIDIQGTALSAIPLRAIAPGAIPLRAIPLRAIPLRAIPLRAIPLRAIDAQSIEIGSIPLRAIGPDAIPLRAIPLRAIDVLGSPLRAIPLRAIDPALVDCTSVNCASGTLGDAVNAGAISGDVTFEQIQSATSDLSLADLVAALGDDAAADLIAGLELSLATLDDLTSLDGLTLGELPRGIVELDAVTLDALLAGLPVGTLADLIEAIIDPATGNPVEGLETAIRDAIASLNRDLGDLEVLGDVTLDAILDGDASVTLEDIEPVLRFITVQSLADAFPDATITVGSETLGDLTQEQLGQLTLTDISRLIAGESSDVVDIGDVLTALGLTDFIDDLTLGDLLLALVDPGSLAYGGVEFADVDVSALPAGTVGSTTFDAVFTLAASTPRFVNFEVQVPSSAAFVRGTGTITSDGGAATPLEPTLVGTVLSWSFLAQPDVAYTITFDVLPTLTLGSTSLSGTASLAGTDVSVPATASVTVVEGIESNDFTDVVDTTKAFEDVVYLAYIPDETDVDVFEVTVGEDDELVIELSNLDADLDLALWGSENTTGGIALANASDEAPLFAVTDPDAAASDAEPLDDFPRLDDVEASLGVIAVSNQPGTATERISTGRLDAGTYYIQVYGANGATTVQPAALQLKVLEADERPECVATDLDEFTGLASVAPGASALAAADTLILINERRIEQIHGVADRDAVRAAADRLVAAAAADPALGITPVVVPVDAYSAVQAAYDNWDSAAGSCDPDAANAVVAAINDAIIDPIRAQLDHVTILGPDEIIPMARLADSTQIANEYDYRYEFDGDLTGDTPAGRNAFTSTMWESSILSDEPYGDAAARSLGDRYLYVTDIALGRVVETPEDIVDALDTYVEFDGNLDINTASVLGYDFLADGSEAIADALDDTIAVVDDELALGPDPTTPDPDEPGSFLGWNEARATQKLREAAENALVSLNAHFDHYRALPAIGDKVPGFEDNLIAQTVLDRLGPDSLAQSLVFSMGCHSGLSVSDITIGRTNADWAQTLGRQGALFVGNTGFGYGDTETVAYTEQLMLLFAQQVTSPLERADGTSTTVGQALAWAKNKFVAELQTFSVYDEKAVMESTFYGLPFYRVGGVDDQLPQIPPAPTNVTQDDATGTPSIQTTLESTITNDVNDGDRGRYYSNVDAAGNELVIVAPGRPLQPKVVSDISVVDAGVDSTELSEVARGAIVLDQTSEYVPNPDPVIATPVFDEELSQGEPELTSGVFPTKPTRITMSTGPGGERQQLVLATGQYDSETGIQRLDHEIDLVVYYAPLAAIGGTDDFTPPTIGAVTSSVSGGALTVSLTATAEPGDSVDRVYLLVAENPGEGTVDWRGLDLAPVPGSDRWTGSLALTIGTTAVEFIVQAKDRVGNVGYATNKAKNFAQLETPPPPPPPPPPQAQLDVVVPIVPASGWFTDSVEIEIRNAATPATVIINNIALPGTFTTGDTFTITDDGVQNWRVVTATGRVAGGTVQIDSDGAPRVILGVPAEAGIPTYATGTRNLDAICRDTTLVACTFSIGGVPVEIGDPLPSQLGSYELSYIATDKIGNTTSGTADFEIEAVTASPVIVSSTIPVEPLPIAGGVTVSASFTDASLPFDAVTATIDWGDGLPSELVVQPLPDGSQPLSFTASRVYAETGSYPVTVTVRDEGGLSASVTGEVVVYDPAAPPVFRGIDAPLGDRLITSPIDIVATFTDESIPVDTFTATIDWGDGTVETVDGADIVAPTFAAAGTVTGSHQYTLPGAYTVVVTVEDESGVTDDIGAPVSVIAPAGEPVIESIDGPTTPQEITESVLISATFSDTSAPFDTFTATVDWGDGTQSTAQVADPTGPSERGVITADHVYSETGVYPVTITVVDQDGASDSELFEFVVVFDPDTTGRVAGSGTYWSGSEAYAGTSRWGSPAFFGYNARYRDGADVPTGETQLRLLGKFFFRSTSYDYLIVNDAIAIAEGVGRIGTKNYRFRVQGIDNGWLDFFQITIWDPTTDEVLYDNGVLYDKGDVVLLGGIKVRGG